MSIRKVHYRNMTIKAFFKFHVPAIKRPLFKKKQLIIETKVGILYLHQTHVSFAISEFDSNHFELNDLVNEALVFKKKVL